MKCYYFTWEAKKNLCLFSSYFPFLDVENALKKIQSGAKTDGFMVKRLGLFLLGHEVATEWRFWKSASK